MSNEVRVMWLGFIGTWLVVLAIVGTFLIGQGWKITKPFPLPLWVLPGQVLALASMGLIAYLGSLVVEAYELHGWPSIFR